MRVHAACDLDARAWRHKGSPGLVQFRIGAMRYSATADEAREFAASLLAAADAVDCGHPAGMPCEYHSPVQPGCRCVLSHGGDNG